MLLAPYVRPELTLILDEVRSRDDLFRRLADAAARDQPGLDPDRILEDLVAREDQTPTGTAEGVAFPHAVSRDIPGARVIVALLRDGVDFGVPDQRPCDLIFCLVGSADSPWEHVKLLARLARIVHTEVARAQLRAAATPAELNRLLLEHDQRHG